MASCSRVNFFLVLSSLILLPKVAWVMGLSIFFVFVRCWRTLTPLTAKGKKPILFRVASFLINVSRTNLEGDDHENRISKETRPPIEGNRI